MLLQETRVDSAFAYFCDQLLLLTGCYIGSDATVARFTSMSRIGERGRADLRVADLTWAGDRITIIQLRSTSLAKDNGMQC